MDELEKRVARARKLFGDDLLGATFAELIIRMSEENFILVAATACAFYEDLSRGSRDTALAFLTGVSAAAHKIKEDMKHGRSIEDDD